MRRVCERVSCSVRVPVEVDRGPARAPGPAVLLDGRGLPAPERHKVCEALLAIVIGVPQLKIRELVAVFRRPEDGGPHVIARVDGDLHALRLEVAHQVVQEAAVRVRVLPAAARTRVRLDVDPVDAGQAAQIIHYLIHLVLRRDLPDARKVVRVVVQTCSLRVLQSGLRVRVDRSVRLIAAHDRERVARVLHAGEGRLTHRRGDVHSVRRPTITDAHCHR